MTTVQTIVNDAFIESSVADFIDGAGPDELSLGLRYLNRIVARASTKNILIPYSTSESFSATAGQETYTMGSGGTASSTRAKKITSARVRDSSNLDSPLEIMSELNYNAIPDKTLQDMPSGLFYDPIYPVGIIHLQSVPNATYTVYIESQKDLQSTLTLATSLTLPGEYEDALVLALGAKLARTFSSPKEQSLIIDAGEAWRTIAGLNISQRVPKIVLPFAKSVGDDLFNMNAGFTYTFDFILS